MALSEIKINRIDNGLVQWAAFKGKYLLFVNVASECGYTSQYKQLQELYEYAKNWLEIIALPCNDFGGQEPGEAKDILSFCQSVYGVSFTITEKINIKQDPHPLISYLCSQNNGDYKIDWNFNKFLVDPHGQVVERLRSSVSPFDDQLIKHLPISL